jgi:phospholipid N-methyltransferase
MLEGIDFSDITSIVELGPGTGVFTKEILRRCRPDARVLVIEIEHAYAKLLAGQFGGRVIVERESAHLLDMLLLKHEIEKVGLIVSGLPILLPKPAREAFARSIKRHTDRGAIFRFFTYNPLLPKHAYRDFPVRKISFVPRNLPPLWVYGVN